MKRLLALAAEDTALCGPLLSVFQSHFALATGIMHKLNAWMNECEIVLDGADEKNLDNVADLIDQAAGTG